MTDIMDTTFQAAFGAAIKLVLFVALCWGIWQIIKRVIVVLRALLSPVRNAVRTVVAPLEQRMADHTADALQRAGADKLAAGMRALPKLNQVLERKVGGAIDALERDVRKPGGPL